MQNKKIRQVLKDLVDRMSEIEDAGVVLSDGFVIASKLVHNFDEDKLGTISAALFGLANTAAKQFAKDEVQYMLIKCNRNYIALFRAGDDAELVVDFKDNANIGSILTECISACKHIKELM